MAVFIGLHFDSRRVPGAPGPDVFVIELLKIVLADFVLHHESPDEKELGETKPPFHELGFAVKDLLDFPFFALRESFLGEILPDVLA